jgi:transposase
MLVKEWEEENSKYIKLFYLPPYSPEFNPDEYLNQDYKRNANKNNIPKNQKELKENTQNYMENLQKNPQKIANFFQHPSVKYAC